MVIPPCLTSVLPGQGIPHNIAPQLGFQPYVATWIPDTVYWFNAQPYSSDPSAVRPLPWMRLEYSYNFPRPYNAYAPHAVIAFDETTQALGFTTNIRVPGQTLAVTSKSSLEINGQPAMLFELHGSGATNTANETRVIGVQWQARALWVRVTAVTSGRYLFSIGDGDDVLAWDGTSTDVLLRVARSAQVYTGCDKQTPGAPASN
ncbi:MAG TPA: hypothetical protein VGF38_16415 [Ktedonobacterales bacterium]